jgi:hypothetical protein
MTRIGGQPVLSSLQKLISPLHQSTDTKNKQPPSQKINAASTDCACATLLLDSDANAEFLSQQVAITAVFVCPLAYP